MIVIYCYSPWWWKLAISCYKKNYDYDSIVQNLMNINLHGAKLELFGRSVPWPLRAWLLGSPGLQQPWHGPLTRYVKWLVAHAPGMRHRLQRTPLVNDHGMHHGTCVTHVPWCVSGSLTSGGGENVPGIPGACATRNFTYLARGPLTEYL